MVGINGRQFLPRLSIQRMLFQMFDVLDCQFIRPLFRTCTIYDLALISLIAGFGEEALFRGVVQGVIDRWLGVGYGLATASILFGLLHLITPTYALLAALCGLYFGALLMCSGNLFVAIVPHALYDFIALLYVVRGPATPELAEPALDL